MEIGPREARQQHPKGRGLAVREVLPSMHWPGKYEEEELLESLLTSLPHAAQNGCSNGRSLEKLLQTYSNEPKRLGVKPHETMSHLCL